ncbi:MAG: hypothetical protein GXP08_08295 [Gammaproteobacteria bacterium]|nr:hypothetical protein [Gammaproteobacteria bacterium]
MTPNQIVPVLAERGQYIGSERTFYRVMKAAGQLAHRQNPSPEQRVVSLMSYRLHNLDNF